LERFGKKFAMDLTWPAHSFAKRKGTRGNGQTTMHDVLDMVLIHLVQIGDSAKDLKRISD
jgi:hypothetical protein